ncbi:signaling lymphocytic activation molecule isoform X1 [Rhinopithecus roxellana]|uniref:Signaling lymphocytic activation molecule n=2 Tax=Rhinopithecus TaxID=542827 RepID=A0A2K6LAW5_RHIBE|nr:signaling lymphocytic activation molecule isoform X1 [Rhinopithecus roxellana]XP_017720375.1 PREDICTED: signaling lymphocytic activation molecule isoform X1 [Rhinopithecus bieti]XP_033053042.1 signaling lymphocytic activation molecule isoform X1 [Trachypithecus francoisi]
MDPKGLLALTFVLFLSLAFGASYGTGGRMMNCPKILGQLGSKVLLPLTHERINKSMNKSIHIVVTMAKSLENSVENKIVSLDPSEAGPPRYLGDRYKFYLENLTLGIWESRKEDEGWYLMTLEKNVSVQRFCLQLRLYEQVSTPEIKVLNKTQENGTCTLILGCTAEKGDHVAYSWSEKAGTHPLHPANSSHLLSLTLGPQHADNIYICTVSNAISNNSQTFSPWPRCRTDHSETKPWAMYAGLLGGAIMILIMVVILQLRKRGKTDHYQTTMEKKSLTIYAQVQKPGPLQKKLDPFPAQDPCTTIYVAATEPVPESVQETNSITVYASVTLPES